MALHLLQTATLSTNYLTQKQPVTGCFLNHLVKA